MSKLAVMDYDEYVGLCDAIREKSGTSNTLTAAQAKEAVSGIEILNNGLLDGSLEEFTIPKEVTKLRTYCLAEYEGLKKLTLHDGIEELLYYSLPDITEGFPALPENLRKLEMQPRFGSSRESNYMNVDYIYNDDDNQFAIIGTWFNVDKTKKASGLTVYNSSLKKNISIPFTNVEFLIGSAYYFGAENEITELVIPASIRCICHSIVPYNSIAEYNHIKTIRFEEGSQLEYLIDDCFAYCPELEEVYIPSGEIRKCSYYNVGSYLFGSNPVLEQSVTVHIGNEVSLIANCFAYSSPLIYDFADGDTPLKIAAELGRNVQGELVFPSRLKEISTVNLCPSQSLTAIYFNSIPEITDEAKGRWWFVGNTSITDIYVPWGEGEVPNAPWSASNATIHYNYTGEEGGNEV